MLLRSLTYFFQLLSTSSIFRYLNQYHNCTESLKTDFYFAAIYRLKKYQSSKLVNMAAEMHDVTKLESF